MAFEKATPHLANFSAIWKPFYQGWMVKDVDIVYLDFAKAFDKVDYGVLMHCLRAAGIQGKIGIWVHNFLTDRSQYVKVNGTKSSPTRVISGVPQGTVLGPLLFIVLLTSIGENISEDCYLSSFADDTKLVKKTRNVSDAEEFQRSLNWVYQWATNYNMKFNGTKFNLLRIGDNDGLRSETVYLDCDSNVINESLTAKDLGVLMSSCGSFTPHINCVTDRAFKMCGWILRTFYSRDNNTMLTLYKSLVLCQLDYCSPLWNPNGSAEMCGKMLRMSKDSLREKLMASKTLITRI